MNNYLDPPARRPLSFSNYLSSPNFLFFELCNMGVYEGGTGSQRSYFGFPLSVVKYLSRRGLVRMQDWPSELCASCVALHAAAISGWREMLLPALFTDGETEARLGDVILHRFLKEEVQAVIQACFLTRLCPILPTGHPHLPACFLAFTAGEFF